MFLQFEILQLESCKIKGIPYPVKLRPGSTDLKVFREVFLLNSYDLQWKDPKVIVDAGANTGLTSIFLANKFPDCNIYAVEPENGNFQALSQNTKPLGKITPIHAAVWKKDTFLKIKNENDDAWAFTVQECEKEHPMAIEGISMNSLMSRFSIGYIDILKIDIEGSEAELFSENYGLWIGRTKCILVELHDWMNPNSSKAVFATIASLNFNVSIFSGMLLMVNRDLV